MLVVAGALIAGLGLLLMFSDRIPWIGKLPGDFHVKKDNVEFYFPLATGVVVSVALSVVVWLIQHFLRK